VAHARAEEVAAHPALSSLAASSRFLSPKKRKPFQREPAIWLAMADSVLQQDRDGTTLRRWSLSRAWPTKFVAGEWDNESDENVIESVTLTYDFFELVQ